MIIAAVALASCLGIVAAAKLYARRPRKAPVMFDPDPDLDLDAMGTVAAAGWMGAAAILASIAADQLGWL